MKVVILEPLGVEKNKLSDMAEAVLGSDAGPVFYDTRKEDVPSLIERSRDADVVVLSNIPYPKEVIENCPALKMICIAFTGVDHVDIDFCREKGITVCNCAGYSTEAVSDLVFGLVIALARNIVQCNQVVREGGTKSGLVGFELSGKKFGIVGAGAIGLRTAGIAQAFGCEVYAYSRTPKDISGIKFVELDTLLSECDIVSLHVPLNADTRGMINADKIRLMKKNAILINTARGPVVDSTALAEALKSGAIAGAGIDVFDTEPPLDKDHILLSAPNLIATPHIAFASEQAFEKRADIVFKNIRQWLDKAPQNVIV